jgi:hypothetical protein
VAQRDEESLIDEMREAIRGDRERAAARNGRTPMLERGPARGPERTPEPEPEPEPKPRTSLLGRLLGR